MPLFDDPTHLAKHRPAETLHPTPHDQIGAGKIYHQKPGRKKTPTEAIQNRGKEHHKGRPISRPISRIVYCHDYVNVS